MTNGMIHRSFILQTTSSQKGRGHTSWIFSGMLPPQLPSEESGWKDIIEALNSTSRYLDDLLNNDTPYF